MFFKSLGILGKNARNLSYIQVFNSPKAIKIADNKLKTKAFLSARGIPVPKLIREIKNKQQLEELKLSKLPINFVVKPNKGYGGKGIIPIIYHRNNIFTSVNHKTITNFEFKKHILEILNGTFSISEHNESAFFEELIISDTQLGQFSEGGLPDIRIIVHNLTPVMAMLRLPTLESKGKANLHQGAIGAGIDMAKGQITHLLFKDKILNEHPRFGKIQGFQIPYWDDILFYASKSQLATNLGFLAADIAIDKNKGPTLLEINARPGLSIQLANKAFLKTRLEKLEDVNVKTPERGVSLAKQLFGFSIEKNVKKLTGKPVLGVIEEVKILDHQVINTYSLQNTSRKSNAISIDFAFKNQLIPTKKSAIKTPQIHIKFKLAGQKLVAPFKLESIKKKKYNLILGSKTLSDKFLIDPSIRKNQITLPVLPFFKPVLDYNAIDNEICKVSNQIKFSYYLKPVNLDEESQKFFQNPDYNPKFNYIDFGEDIADLTKKLRGIPTDDTPIGQLFSEKIAELESLLQLIKARGTDSFHQISEQIFGSPNLKAIQELKHLYKCKTKKKSNKSISTEQLKKIFDQSLKDYNLTNWKTAIYNNKVAISIDKKRKTVCLRSGAYYTPEEVEDLIIHEIETHVLTTENSFIQPYKLFSVGFANYLETQEGLAIFNTLTKEQDLTNSTFPGIKINEAMCLAKTMSFSEVYKKLLSQKISSESAFRITLRIKRGFHDTSLPGAYTKDFLYLKGYLQVKQFIQKGGDIKDLYYGKYNLKDLERIKLIKELKPPKNLPHWFK